MNKNMFVEIFKYLGLITYVGVLMTANILIGYYLGTYIQNITGSLALFVVCIFLGVAAGFLSVYKLLSKFF